MKFLALEWLNTKTMAEKGYDIMVIGAGSAGLSVSLFMNKAGFKVLLVSKTDHHIGGDCLNDGCVPSKALIHVARVVHRAKEAKQFGLEVNGTIDIKKPRIMSTANKVSSGNTKMPGIFKKKGWMLL
jgi:pyruvate/2-oxoglutarate dehydrogenase complex dihydrolipoamide dehydrogenase (E3) component